MRYATVSSNLPTSESTIIMAIASDIPSVGVLMAGIPNIVRI